MYCINEPTQIHIQATKFVDIALGAFTNALITNISGMIKNKEYITIEIIRLDSLVRYAI